jgi:uncharacterized protein YdeI (YjbR/CyaY-like superfamily)
MATFFRTPAEFRAWLERHAAQETELVVGFRKRATGQPSITWPESVDEALCFGWIDGVRRRIDDESYQIRFTPRKPTSTWSSINIERVQALQREGRMQPAGLRAFEHRREAKSGTYAYEQRDSAVLAPPEASRFRRHQTAWAFFEAQAPSYRHRMIWGIVSAKRPETRAARLARIIEASQRGEKL